MTAVSQASSRQITRLRKPRFDGWILASVLALTSLGLIMVYSASISQAWIANSSTYFLQKEGVFIAFGLIAMVVGARLNYAVWKRFSTPIAAGSLILLIVVLLPHVGTSSNGAQRWFQYDGFQLEPSELAKIGLAVYFAHWLSKKGDKIRSLGSCTIPFGVMLGLVCILVLKQPDMGTAVVIGMSMIAVYFVAGARLDHLAAGILSGLGAALLVVRMDAYRNTRLSVWLDPWKYARGAGFHIVQALIALGRGGLLGVGPGNSQQKYVLPAPFTDSIFAVTGEELGFLGAVSIIALFVILAYRGFKVATEAPDDFGKLLAIGITATIVIQAFVNIAVITASIPFTGVPLPFISYGGSSLVVCMFGIGVLLNISWQSRLSSVGSRRRTPSIDALSTPNVRLRSDSHLEGSSGDANSDNGRKDRRSRVPSPSRGRGTSPGNTRRRRTGTNAGLPGRGQLVASTKAPAPVSRARSRGYG